MREIYICNSVYVKGIIYDVPENFHYLLGPSMGFYGAILGQFNSEEGYSLTMPGALLICGSLVSSCI